MDQQSRTYNLVNAASSLKNYEFDFGELPGVSAPGAGAAKPGGGSLGGIGGSSLKQQKMATSTPLSQTGSMGTAAKTPDLAAPIAPNFRPMANPWGAAAEKMKGATGATTAAVPVAQSHTVQAAFKEKSSPGAAGTTGQGGNPGTGSQPSWMANYLSSAQAGTAMGKPDPLANLWSTASSTTPVAGARSTGMATGQVTSGGGSSDPFDFFSGGKTSLSALKASKSTSGGGGGSVGGSPVLGSTPARSTTTDPFNLSGMNSAMPAPAQPSTATSSGDPFASLASATSSSPAPKASPAADAFGGLGGFSGAPGASAAAAPVGNGDPFGGFGSAGLADFGAPGSASATPAAASNGFDAFFGAPAAGAAAPPSGSGSDPLADMLFGSGPSKPAASQAGGAVGADDWGAVFGESAVSVDTDGGGTTELEGLPPPPTGLTAGTAADKGEAFSKAGQFADAIKWLLWAESLAGRANGDQGKEVLLKVLITRAGCYKEAGEMKKAVADCSKVLELDPENTVVRMQRAVLYEGLEKYKLGVDDLREVLRLDAGNRPAMNLLNRLQKMV